MKTKRELLASAVLLISSGTILAAAGLATTPSHTPSVNPQTKAAPKVPVQTASVAIKPAPAAIAAATSLAEMTPIPASETDQTLEKEQAIQIVSGDLDKNELYIFSEDATIPEKVIDEHPDAALVVLGANEAKAAEKIQTFNNTVKVVSERKMKEKAIEAIQAEADMQKLNEWNGGYVDFVMDKSIRHDQLAELLKKQAAHLATISLPDRESSQVKLQIQKNVEAQRNAEINRNRPSIADQKLSLIKAENIVLPLSRNLHAARVVITPQLEMEAAPSIYMAEAASIPEPLTVKMSHVSVVFGKNAVIERFALAKRHDIRAVGFRFADRMNVRMKGAIMAPIPHHVEQVPEVSNNVVAVNDQTNLTVKRSLHRYALHLPDYLTMNINVPAVEIAKAVKMPETASVVAENNHVSVSRPGYVGVTLGRQSLTQRFALVTWHRMHNAPVSLGGTTGVNASAMEASMIKLAVKDTVMDNAAPVNNAAVAKVAAVVSKEAAKQAKYDSARASAYAKTAMAANASYDAKVLAEAKAQSEKDALQAAKALVQAKVIEDARSDEFEKAYAEAKASEEAKARDEAKALADAKAVEENRVLAAAKASADAKAFRDASAAEQAKMLADAEASRAENAKTAAWIKALSAAKAEAKVKADAHAKTVANAKFAKASSLASARTVVKAKRAVPLKTIATIKPAKKSPVAVKVASASQKPAKSLGHKSENTVRKANLAARERSLALLEKQLAAEQEPIYHPRRQEVRQVVVARPQSRQEEFYNGPDPMVEYFEARRARDSETVVSYHRPKRDRNAQYNVASADSASSSKEAQRRYRKWRNPAEFSKLMME